MDSTVSSRLYEHALRIIPGGVNSPVRACRSVGRDPLFIRRAKGSKIYDADGREYLDFVASWGPMVLGHADDRVVAAIKDAAVNGTSFGAPTELEVKMAQTIVDAVPSVEMVRMVNSGTEATMSAIRLARGYTGRDLVVKFDGCYHGHADGLLVKAGSGLATFGIPGSPGVPDDVCKNTLSLPYNDTAAFEACMRQAGARIAAVIVEPIAGNMGVVPPADGFLETLRRHTRETGALLIFDEVITGFRVGWGGAQERFGIRPDLTCLGKIIGGGLPVGAFGGRQEIMRRMAPEGDIYQAGTLSGNPLAMAAGLATLDVLMGADVYETLDRKSTLFWNGMKECVKEAGIPAVVNAVGSMGALFFTSDPVTDFVGAMRSDRERFARYYSLMLDRGVYLAPSAYEASFISMAHCESDLERAWDAFRDSLRRLS
ncbi:MAG: glutamate-1-semialdehyde 2,1-aminomutase [Deltaproteobacteria bacterium]|nr:glutamate-1-semialdehyde 2,1-aminomutase [Deltaproteobacteria bacterium]